jgi:hypothetical protein
MAERQDERESSHRRNRKNPADATSGNKPGAMHGVGNQTERPDLEQKIDESRGPGERTGEDAG